MEALQVLRISTAAGTRLPEGDQPAPVSLEEPTGARRPIRQAVARPSPTAAAVGHASTTPTAAGGAAVSTPTSNSGDSCFVCQSTRKLGLYYGSPRLVCRACKDFFFKHERNCRSGRSINSQSDPSRFFKCLEAGMKRALIGSPRKARRRGGSHHAEDEEEEDGNDGSDDAPMVPAEDEEPDADEEDADEEDSDMVEGGAHAPGACAATGAVGFGIGDAQSVESGGYGSTDEDDRPKRERALSVVTPPPTTTLQIARRIRAMSMSAAADIKTAARVKRVPIKVRPARSVSMSVMEDVTLPNKRHCGPSNDDDVHAASVLAVFSAARSIDDILIPVQGSPAIAPAPTPTPVTLAVASVTGLFKVQALAAMRSWASAAPPSDDCHQVLTDLGLIQSDARRCMVARCDGKLRPHSRVCDEHCGRGQAPGLCFQVRHPDFPVIKPSFVRWCDAGHWQWAVLFELAPDRRSFCLRCSQCQIATPASSDADSDVPTPDGRLGGVSSSHDTASSSSSHPDTSDASARFVRVVWRSDDDQTIRERVIGGVYLRKQDSLAICRRNIQSDLEMGVPGFKFVCHGAPVAFKQEPGITAVRSHVSGNKVVLVADTCTGLYCESDPDVSVEPML